MQDEVQALLKSWVDDQLAKEKEDGVLGSQIRKEGITPLLDYVDVVLLIETHIRVISSLEEIPRGRMIWRRSLLLTPNRSTLMVWNEEGIQNFMAREKERRGKERRRKARRGDTVTPMEDTPSNSQVRPKNSRATRTASKVSAKRTRPDTPVQTRSRRKTAASADNDTMNTQVPSGKRNMRRKSKRR